MEHGLLIGGVYQHYSGKQYVIKDVVRSSEDYQLYVVYQGLYDCPRFGSQPTWMRPLTMFMEEVEINGIKQPRFARMSL